MVPRQRKLRGREEGWEIGVVGARFECEMWGIRNRGWVTRSPMIKIVGRYLNCSGFQHGLETDSLGGLSLLLGMSSGYIGQLAVMLILILDERSRASPRLLLFSIHMSTWALAFNIKVVFLIAPNQHIHFSISKCSKNP
jgi:hypothetical protein